MKNIKKLSLYLLVMVFTLASIIPLTKLSADETTGTGGTIKGTVQAWNNSDARQYTVTPDGVLGGATEATTFTQVVGMKVTLFKADGTKVREVLTGHVGQGGTPGEFRFTGLEDGQYYVVIDDHVTTGTIKNDYLVVPGDTGWTLAANRNRYENFHIQKNKKSEIFTISNGNTVEDIIFPIVSKPHKLTLKTRVGNWTTNNGQETKTLQLLPGIIYNFQDGDPPVILNSILGVLDNDKIGNMQNELPIPILSNEEMAIGYEFLGWTPDEDMLAIYPKMRKGDIYTTNGALDIVAKGDITLRAVFKFPIYQVQFATDVDKGVIEYTNQNDETQDVAYLTYTMEEPGQKVSQLIAKLPKVKAKEGYEFEGWFKDLTKNVIPDEDILDTVINKNLNFYAKYRKIDKSRSVVPSVEPMIEDGTTIKGTGVAGASVEVMLPGGTTRTVIVSEEGTWTVDNVTLRAGDIYSFVQTETGKTESRTISGTVIRKDVETSENPIINKIFTDDLMITGKGIAGSSIIVTFNDGSKVATTVLEDGSWTATVPQGFTLEKGQTVSAVQVEVNKKASSSVDGTVIEREKEVSQDPRIDAVKEDAKVITGRGIAGSTITVTFKDGTSVETTVKEDNTWSVDVPENITLKAGDVVSSVQTEKGKLRSSSVDATVVCECDKDKNNDNGGNNNQNGGNDNNGGSNNQNGGNDNNGGNNNQNGGNDNNGGSTATTDKVKTPSTNNTTGKKTVNTGDDSLGVLFAGMLALSGVGIVIARKRYEK